MSCLNCKTKYSEYYKETIYTWCTNCGNYGVHAAVKRALVEEDYSPKDVLLCFDVGCHGNGSDKIGGYRFHGLHGRVIPLACGASMANENVKIIAFGGDGGTLGEGINHLIHSIRSNYNITFVLHNNSNYGLTKGQASPTTHENVPMNSSPKGQTADILNPMELVLTLNPSFAARAFSGDVNHMTSILRKAFKHKGFSFVEILQSCPTYNKETPHEWYLTHTYKLEDDPAYNTSDLAQALTKSKDIKDNIALGVLYEDSSKPYQNERFGSIDEYPSDPLAVRSYDISSLIKRFI